MFIPGFNFIQTALHLFTLGRKRKEVRDMLAKVKEQASSYGEHPDGLDEDEVIGALEFRKETKKLLEEDVRERFSMGGATFTILDKGDKKKVDGVPIDVLCRDCAGNTVVIAARPGKAAMKDVSKVVNFMGAVSEEEGKKAKGILVAFEFPGEVTRAAKVIDGFKLIKCVVEFSMESVVI